MADIADIVIRVDSTQLVGASTATQGLQRNTLGLLASLSRAGAASMQYQREVKLLQDAERQSIITNNELSRSLRQLELRYNSMGLAVDSAGNLIESAQGQANKFGHNIQQVGYQVGDFFVQIQSGTNFLVAFGQQATQLAGLVPGALGAALGIGISLFSAIGATLMRSSESAGTFQDSLDKVNDVLSETEDVLKIVSGDFEILIEKFGRLSPAIMALADTRVDITLRNLSDAAKGLKNELTDMYSGSAFFNTSRAEELSSAFELSSKSSRELSFAMENLRNQDTLQGQVDAATALRELFLSMAGPVEKMTSDELAFYLAIVDSEEAFRSLHQRTTEVQKTTGSLVDVMFLFVDAAGSASSAISNIGTQASGAVNVVKSLASAMWEAAQTRISAERALESMKIEFSSGGQALMKYGARGTVVKNPDDAGREKANKLEEDMATAYQKQRAELIQNYQLEVARLKLGEDSFQFKQLQAEADKRSYEEQLSANGKLNAQQIAGLMAIYEAQQNVLKARQSELVVIENQRAADDARGKERLAAEQEYQAAIDKTVAKNQYWSEQAKAAERQQVAVEYIVNNLNMLAVKQDAEGFNKVMEDALAAGVQFSLVDLSRIVAIAARNGWDLAASIQAAWSAATQKAPAAASVLVGGAGRPEVGIDRKAIAGAEAMIVQKNLKESQATVSAGAGGGGATESALENLQKQLALEKELLGTSESYQKVRSALGEDFVNTNPKIVEGLVQQADEIKNLTRLEEERQSLMDSVNGTLESGFMDMVKGTKTVGEAFRSMAAAIIEELFRVLVVQKLVGGITSAFGGGGFTNAQAGRLTGGGRASGGSMMAGQSYLVGEQGPEIVVPRHSGTVVNAKQTAGAMANSGSITVQNNITVTGSDAAMVRQEVAKMIPQITNATKAAVIDAKQRGGQMAAAFR